MRMRSLAGFTFILMATVAGAAADEWRVEKLDGLVFVHHEARWHRLELGDVVADDRVIRTLPSGSVEFVRDEEHIVLDGSSQIQIKDAERARFTTVEQWYGKVTIEAEKQNVQHFSVQTPFLAAVVKGTRFTVISKDGQSRVSVEEGTVQVRDQLYEVVTDVQAGQRADVAPGNMLEVSGPGPKAPVVTLGNGEIVTEAIRRAVEDGDILPGEIGKAVANVAAGVDPGKGLGRDNANANGRNNQDNSGNSSRGGGSGNSGNGGGGGGGLNIGIGNGSGNSNAGSGGGGGINVSVGGGNGNSGSGGGIGVDVNVGGGGLSLNVGGGGSGSGGTGPGNGDDGGLLDVDLDVGGAVGGLLG